MFFLDNFRIKSLFVIIEKFSALTEFGLLWKFSTSLKLLNPTNQQKQIITVLTFKIMGL